MRKIYIVTTYTGTVLSYMIRNISHNQYSHVSIALSEDLSPMYSFGRLFVSNPLFAGFVEEEIHDGLYAIRKGTVCRVYSLEIEENQYKNLIRNINRVKRFRDRYDYDRKALVMMPLNINRHRPYKFVCSTFVANMLEKSGIGILDKPFYDVKPDDYYDLKGLELEYEGLLSHYNKGIKDTVPNILNY